MYEECVCRLALAQEMQPLKVPVLSTKAANEDDDRQAILDSIQAMIPNHKARLEFLQVWNACNSLIDITTINTNVLLPLCRFLFPELD